MLNSDRTPAMSKAIVNPDTQAPMNIRLPLPSIALLLACAGLSVASSAQNPASAQEPIGPPAPMAAALHQAPQISEYVREVFQDRGGDYWFGTNGDGVSRYDGTTFTAFGEEQGLSMNEFPCPCGSGNKFKLCHGPNGAHVQELFEDQDGILWFGCSGGLFRLDGESVINVTREGPWPERATEPKKG